MSVDVATVLAAAETGFDIRELCSHEDALGPCPCFTIDLPDFGAEGHCWRSACDDHPYDSRKSDGRCCVHVRGDPVLAERLRYLLDVMDWYGGWALEMES